MKTRTLVIRFDSGEVKRATFPETWRVTFSNFISTHPTSPFGGTKRPSIRVYAGHKQMACFTEVNSFRDTRIQIEQLNKSDLDDLYWTSQEELDEAPMIRDGNVESAEDYRLFTGRSLSPMLKASPTGLVEIDPEETEEEYYARAELRKS